MTFQGELRPEQIVAAQAMLAQDTGVLAWLLTAFGKTVVAAWLIAKRGVNTLVLVHRRRQLQQQWDRATFHLLGNAGSRYWADWWGPQQAHRPAGCGGDPEPGSKRCSR